MRSAHRIAIALAGLASMTLAVVGCRAPGKPASGPEVLRPDQVLDFSTLYKQNCAACHGEDGHHGNAVSLSNPVYLNLAGRDVLVNVIAKGVPGELMPAFAQSQGGSLTDQQVDVLVDGMEQRWGHPGLLAGANPPSYAATLQGNPTAGQTDYVTYCARCHSSSTAAAPAGATRPSGASQFRASQAQQSLPRDTGSLANPDFLALISDQSLRSTILAGRPDEGMPDWRGFGPQPLTDRQVTDIVAWLATQRPSLAEVPNPKAAPVPQPQNANQPQNVSHP